MRHIRGAFYLLLMTLLAISSILIAGCNLSDSDRATSDDEDSLINDLETKPIIPMQLLADSNALVEGTEIRISDSGSVYIAGNYLDPAIYFYVENGSEINDRQLGSFLVKLNDDGSVDWHKLFPKERGVMGSEFAALTLADDSVFLGLNISGDSVGSQSMEAGFRDTRVQITCMNQDGEIQWANTWGDNWDIILDMCIDSSSSNYFYGMTISQDTGMPWHFLNEIGVDGNIGWSKQWLGDHPVRLAIDEEDRIFIIGMVNAELNQEESAIHLISYSPDRDNSSDNLVNIAGELELEDMAISNNGRILIAGSYESDLILNSTEIISGNGLRDIFLAQIERNGSIFWLRTWGGAGVDIARGIFLNNAN